MALASDRSGDFRSPLVWARRAGTAALNLLYPPVCLVCRGPAGDSHRLCAACWSGLTFFDGAMCECCGLPFELDPGAETLCASCLAHPPPFDRARAAAAYDDASKGAILALKRADRLELSRLFVPWLKQCGRLLIEQADLVVPVPLHRQRLWRRRYNQAAILAQQLAKLAGKRFEPTLLQRNRPTPSQGEMVSPKARRRNVQGAFAVPARKAPLAKGQTVLLIDDVLTTGATVAACSRALKRAGAIRVFVVTIARVARPLPEGI